VIHVECALVKKKSNKENIQVNQKNKLLYEGLCFPDQADKKALTYRVYDEKDIIRVEVCINGRLFHSEIYTPKYGKNFGLSAAEFDIIEEIVAVACHKHEKTTKTRS
jgi:hypothetical protein